MEVKYFNALIQIILRLDLFDKNPPRKQLLRMFFENEIFIPEGEIDNKAGWGVGNTRYFKNYKWLFGFLYKVVDASDISTIPPNANSLKEISHLDQYVVNKTPFFFNFETQRIYTQSQWKIVRVSSSASNIWKRMLYYKLEKYIQNLDVQSIPDRKGFKKQISELKLINKAEFDLFGPNVLNDKRIRSLISDFHPTDTEGIIITLKNYLKGLKTDVEEFKFLVNYLLRGGGKGIFHGKDNKNNDRKVKTDSKHEKISVSNRLDEESSEKEITDVLNEIIERESENDDPF